ncbi:NAD(P)-dependent dehydrogenase (short-subunit alcohol dehydrogenase family) [Angulomicrobium tetraedrale]|uniref:NAD(P)-dependent dehydrogenase (Short-subunit alcohol dehydrogenase family) n=1 Tax=Ancylobacter tetraedralis TaxID=217068 RepID=A0A839ZCU8_9HYPH|nr:SDR family NAD(P)-dependent oxidoreductase [Ancylobacter tetraedralis]MBB3772559.1 NAD(P)-dependent dehydrogenase (short-subunit alcohol dehydrogenase family) [Ancylobacter tetraedralis]
MTPQAPATPLGDPLAARRLAGRVALVTGAAHGIGAGIAERLATEGAQVVIADIDEAGAHAVAARLGKTAMAVRVDIADPESVAALAAAVEARHGRCEIVVNNAAILDTRGIDTMSFAHYRGVLDINQDGAVRVTLAMLPLIRRAGAGRRILNIVSIQGLRGARDSLAYATAKGALVNFTRALACDLADDGILVNALAPGFIDTAMALLPEGAGHEHETDWFRDIYIRHGRIPLRRPGTPVDIAGPAFFLCSDDARYVTGQVLLVDGGLSATF